MKSHPSPLDCAARGANRRRAASGIGSHARTSEGLSDSWITPRWVIDALGPFDLDPCASIPQPWPCARRSLTIKEDGLGSKWEGRVFLNPPYGRQTGPWLDRLAAHGRGTALVFARTETAMFQEVWRKADALLFLRGRLRFHWPDGSLAGNAGGPSVLVAYGEKDVRLLHESMTLKSVRGAITSRWGWAF
jgi:hypothetical protein